MLEKTCILCGDFLGLEYPSETCLPKCDPLHSVTRIPSRFPGWDYTLIRRNRSFGQASGTNHASVLKAWDDLTQTHLEELEYEASIRKTRPITRPTQQKD